MSKNAVGDVNNQKVDRVEMPVPSTGIFDSPLYVKKVNADWWRHINGIVQGLTEKSAWYGADPDIARAVDEIHAFLSKEWEVIENCDDVNNCLDDASPVMQAIYESRHNQDNATLAQVAQSRYERYVAVNNSTVNYNSAIGYSWLDTDSATDKAVLCGAVFYWLSSIRETLNSYGTMAIQGLFGAQTGLTIAAITASPTGVAPIALGVTGIGLGYTANTIQGWIDAFNNQAAFDEVACEMQKRIAQASLSEQGYFDALSSVASAVTLPDSQTIMQYINTYYGNSVINTFNKTSAYLWFVDIVASHKTTYQPPSGSDCGCIEDTPCSGLAYRYPPSPKITPDNLADMVYHDGGVVVGSQGVKIWRINCNYGTLGINTDKRCHAFVQFATKNIVNASGTGTYNIDVYVDGVFTRSQTLTGNVPYTIYLFPDTGYHPCSTVEFLMRTTGTSVGYVEISGIDFGARE